jgi:hypothetical protein
MKEKGFFQKWIDTAITFNDGLQERIKQQAKGSDQKVMADGVLNEVLDKALMRTVVQMTHWRLGLDMHEDPSFPDRSYLHQIYNEIILDAQVLGKINVAHQKVEASEFFFVDKQGNENEELTELFKTSWFSKYLKESLNSEFYGYTLFQFPEMDTPMHFDANGIDIIPRHLVLPNVRIKGKRDGLVLPRTSAQDGVSFKYGKYSHRLLGVGNEEAFGMFAAIAPLFIYKKNALSFWAGYQQRYGEPTMAIQMSTWNKETHGNYAKFLKNRGTNSGLILRNTDDAKLLEANRMDAFRVYHEMLKYCDDGINKIIEGNVGTSEVGGSKSTSATHENVANIVALGRLKHLGYTVNDRLIPFLQKKFGWDFKGCTYKWKEFKDVDSEVENVTKLSTVYEMSPEEIKKRTGFIVEGIRKDIDERISNKKIGSDPSDKTKNKRD